MTEKVVPLFRDRDADDREAPLAERRSESAVPRPRPRTCRHTRADIEPDLRKLFCRDCGEVLDPFEHLLKLAREDGRWRQARDAAERTARQAQIRLDDLLLEEKRAKGRLKRARDRERELNTRLTRLDAELRAFTPDPQPEET